MVFGIIKAVWWYLDVDDEVRKKVSAETLDARSARSIGKMVLRGLQIEKKGKDTKMAKN